VYATLGPDAVKTSLEEGAVGTILLSKAAARGVLDHILKAAAAGARGDKKGSGTKKRTTPLKNVIIADATGQAEVDAAIAGVALPDDVCVLSFGQVCELGRSVEESEGAAVNQVETANLPSPECEYASSSASD
jgi:hypothetical protein